MWWRRQLLQFETFLCLVVFFTQIYRCSPSLLNNNSQSGNVNQCARIDVRKSWTRLTKQKQQDYISAFQSLSKFQTGGALSFAQKLSILHDSSTLYIHNDLTGQHKAMFFPWHRFMLRLYEKELQKYQPNLAIPYWNWFKIPSALNKDPLFNQLGLDKGDPFFGLMGFNSSEQMEHLVYRELGVTPKSLLPRDYMQNFWKEQSYQEFLRSVKEPHDKLHVAVGGTMSTWNSPCDPLFPMHHSMVDYLWWNWQNIPGNHQKYGYLDQNSPLNPLSALPKEQLVGPLEVGIPFLGKVVRDVLRADLLCYQYEHDPAQNEVSSINSQGITVMPKANLTGHLYIKAHLIALSEPTDGEYLELLKLPHPITLTPSFIKDFSMNESDVRVREELERTLVDQLNNVKGYVSKDALLFNDDAIMNIITEAQKQRIYCKFKATTDNAILLLDIMPSNESPVDLATELKQMVLSSLDINTLSDGSVVSSGGGGSEESVKRVISDHEARRKQLVLPELK